ncbi:MAG: O-antigen polymerase [Bacteroidota bacterium]
MNQSFSLFINLSLYVGYFIFILRGDFKGKRFALLILSLFVISALCSLLYYKTPTYFLYSEGLQKEISFEALLFLFLNIVLFLRPVLSYNISHDIKVPNYKILYYLGIFLGIVSIIPFIENLVYIKDFNAAKFAEVYFDKMEEGFSSRTHLSTIGRIGNGIASWFMYITPSIFFYMLASKRKKIYIFLSLIAFINPILIGLITGGRGDLFQLILVLIFNYLLFRKYFSEKQDRTILMFGASFGFVAVLILSFITFARSSGNSSEAYEEIYRYLGEGFVNFAEKAWYIKRHTDGYSIFNGTGETFLKDFSDYFNARDYIKLGGITGLRMYVYYTVFGDYFIDFGLIGALLFNIGMAAVFYQLVKRKEAFFSSIILFNLYAKIGFNGIYHFLYMYKIEFVFFTLLMVFIFRKFEKQNVKGIFLANSR